MVKNMGGDNMNSSNIKTWGSPAVVIIVGSVVAIALGGTRFFPLVAAVFASIIIYWTLVNTQKAS